jgi:hypothetical protein
MKPVKVPLAIPEARTPPGFLRLKKIGVVTQETERKTIDYGRDVQRFGKTVHQQCPEIRAMGLMA